MVTTKWIKRAILWCFRFSLALGGQCVIFGIIYGNLFVLRFLWYSSADQGTFYPASRGYIFAVWAGVRKCQLIPRKCSLCSQGRNMQMLHAEFDKKIFFSHLFSRKNYFNTIRIEITSERQNDKLQKKRHINFTSIKESPYWLNNFPKHHPSYESVLNFVRPIYLLSFLIVFLFYVWLNFFDCLYFSINWPADGGIG